MPVQGIVTVEVLRSGQNMDILWRQRARMSCWISSEMCEMSKLTSLCHCFFSHNWKLEFWWTEITQVWRWARSWVLLWWICNDRGQPNEIVREADGHMGLEYSWRCKIGSQQRRRCSERWVWVGSWRSAGRKEKWPWEWVMGHSNEQKAPRGSDQWGRKKTSRVWCPRSHMKKVCQRPGGSTVSDTFGLKCIGNLKSIFRKKLYQFFFSQKLLMAQKLPAARWRHLRLTACGVIGRHLLTWQCSFQWHFQHHLEGQESQSGWRRQRWAGPNPCWQILIREVRENEDPGHKPQESFENFFEVTANSQIGKVFKFWFIWIWNNFFFLKKDNLIPFLL